MRRFVFIKTVRAIGIFFLVLMLTANAFAQPEIPLKEWTGKTILFIGAHPDEDSYANGNEVNIAILTTGNVGTQDSGLSMSELTKIRLKESQAPEIRPEIRYGDGIPEWGQNSTDIQILGTRAMMHLGVMGGGWQVFEKGGEGVAQQSGVHLANISYLTGCRQQIFSPEYESILNDRAARELVSREYRKGFEVPETV